mgnify:CR=1 FL=1
MMTDVPDPKRKSNRWFLFILALVSVFMYLSIIYKLS